MKNIPELSCAIVEDLLPTYVEGLTSEETNMAVESHLASCPACAAKRAAMGAEDVPSEEAAGEASREVDYLKKVRRRGRRRIMLAVLATLLVLAAGFAAKAFLIGSPLDPDRMVVTSFYQWDGRFQVTVVSTDSGVAFHGWTEENQDGVVSITARSVLPSFLYHTDGGTRSFSSKGVTEIWLGEVGEGRLIWQEDTEISADAWALYQAQTPYVGDNSAVGRVLAAVDTWYGPPIVDYTISLQTSSEPYGLTIHFDSVTAYVSGAGRSLDKRMYAIAPSLLALIGNLGEVRWTYAAPDGTAVTRSVTLEEVDQALPDWIEARNLAYHQDNSEDGTDWIAPESVKDYAASPAAVQRLMDLTDYGFYVVTVEDGAYFFNPWP
ncbi:DUF4825 domain-containing protein [uncultured Oscillibacter sp.]|uniref:DUF4825 domain-containing protein n=1 Tax=Dysosmobacter sp. TaxID=2591382 RepID=UPI0026308754|nr:DUF4825 domain-containing protein [uncultured Oscillibacter sp.]